jgi:hypothetical protein
MLNTVMFVSDYEVRDTRTIRDDTIERMNLSRAGILCLAALLTTAMWAPILYFGAQLLGIPMEMGVLLRISAGIFCLSLFGLGLAVSAGEDSDENGSGPGDPTQEPPA